MSPNSHPTRPRLSRAQLKLLPAIKYQHQCSQFCEPPALARAPATALAAGQVFTSSEKSFVFCLAGNCQVPYGMFHSWSGKILGKVPRESHGRAIHLSSSPSEWLIQKREMGKIRVC